MLLGGQYSQPPLFTQHLASHYWCGCKCRRDPVPAKSIAISIVLGQGCSKPPLFTFIYILLGGQCSQPLLFIQHLASHTGVAVSVIEIRFQPKVSLFPLFWARAAPKHCYLHALGGQCSQTILFMQHLASHTGVAVSVVEIRFQRQLSLFAMFWARAAPKHRYLQAFGRPVLPDTIIYATFVLSYWSGCKCVFKFCFAIVLLKVQILVFAHPAPGINLPTEHAPGVWIQLCMNMRCALPFFVFHPSFTYSAAVA